MDRWNAREPGSWPGAARGSARAWPAACRIATIAFVFGALLVGCRSRERELEHEIADRRAEIEQARVELERAREELATAKRRPRAAAPANPSARLATVGGLAVTLERYGENGYTCDYAFNAINRTPNPVALTYGEILFKTEGDAVVRRDTFEEVTLAPKESRPFSNSFHISQHNAEEISTAEVRFFTTYGPITTSITTPRPN